MKKIGLIILILFISLTISGCKTKSVKKAKSFQVEIKDNIKAKATITKILKNKIIRINFDRLSEGTKVKTKVEYYQDLEKDEMVYEDNFIYVFPNEQTDCLFEIPVRTTITTLNNNATEEDIKDKNYNENNTKKEKLSYDYIKLTISNYKEQ